MQRLQARDFHPEVMRLFNRYIHGGIDRRTFLADASRYTVTGVTASMLLDSLMPRYAEAAVVQPNDARIVTRRVDVPSPQGHGTVKAYVAEPANRSGRLPGILVIHENRGLNPHIEDIARRLALDNFVAVAPDGLSGAGGYPGDEEKAAAAYRAIDKNKMLNDFIATAQWLREQPAVNGKWGAVGFCAGGTAVNTIATRLPDMTAGVPFYGGAPDLADIPRTKARLQMHFAGNDEFINPRWPAHEAALKAAGVRYEAFVYANTLHGFNNDTTPRYDANAAKAAWERTVTFFNQNLR